MRPGCPKGKTRGKLSNDDIEMTLDAKPDVKGTRDFTVGAVVSAQEKRGEVEHDEPASLPLGVVVRVIEIEALPLRPGGGVRLTEISPSRWSCSAH